MKRILIIDDDVVIRIAFDKLLKKNRDYIIDKANDVGKAVELMRNKMYNLILLDLKLPTKGWKGGYEILKRKKKLPFNVDTPVIIVSGEHNEQSIKSNIAEEDNIAGIFIKPVENEDLLKRVMEILQ